MMKLIKPDFNKPVFVLFPDKAKIIEQGKCPFCYKEINEDDFDELSAKEFSISGLCPKCQDATFGGNE